MIAQNDCDHVALKCPCGYRPVRTSTCRLRERHKGRPYPSGDDLPLALSVENAHPAECRFVGAILAGCFLDELPERLIGDHEYALTRSPHDTRAS